MRLSRVYTFFVQVGSLVSQTDLDQIINILIELKRQEYVSIGINDLHLNSL